MKYFETSAIFLLFSGLGCRIATFQGFESLFIDGLRRSGSSKAFLLPDCGVPGLRKPFLLPDCGVPRPRKPFLLSDCDVPGLRKPFCCRIATFQGLESLFYCRIAAFQGLESLFVAGLRRSRASKAFFIAGLRRSGSSNVVWLSDMPIFLFRNGGCGEDVLRLPGGLRWEVVELLVTFYIILPQDGVGLSSVVGIGLGCRFA